MTDHITADSLRTIAEGPALDLPPIHWEPPVEATSNFARWGALPGEDAETNWVPNVPNVYLGTYDNRGLDPLIELGDEAFTAAEARIVLNRLASAIAMAEEVSR